MWGRSGRRAGARLAASLALCLSMGLTSCGLLGGGKYDVSVEGGEREDVRSFFLLVDREDELPEPKSVSEFTDLIAPDKVREYCLFVQLEPSDVDLVKVPNARETDWCWSLLGDKQGRYRDLASVTFVDERPYAEVVVQLKKIRSGEGDAPLAILCGLQGSGTYDWKYFGHSLVEAKEAVRLEVRQDTLTELAE